MTQVNPPLERVNNLDYFRGVAATSIMLFHFCFWSYGIFNSEDILGRVGIYGVSVFYILSGLTMCIVYQDKISTDIKSILDFLLKRVVRIFPLLWLATTLAILTNFKRFPSITTIFLNYTGLFGFIKPSDYIGNGVWSIGNELVFYIFLPILILSFKYFKTLFYFLLFITVVLIIYFSFFYFKQPSLANEWKRYVNPFNHIHFFIGGYVIGLYFKDLLPNKILLRILLITGLLLFCFYPVFNDRINLVTGLNRLFFSLICFVITFAVYKDNYQLKGPFKNFMLFLGEASYSIYLLHQFVFFCFNGLSLHYLHLSKPLLIVCCIILTFTVSYFVYNFFEKPLTEKGRVWIKKKLYK